MSKKETRLVDRYKDVVECNICHKWMTLDKYDNHYDRCMSTQYLIHRIYQEKGVIPEYDEIFYLPREKFEGLYQKYFKKVVYDIQQ